MDSTRRRESPLGTESETGNDIRSMSRSDKRGRCGIADDLGLKKGWDGASCRILGSVVEAIGSDERMWNDSVDALWIVVVERLVVCQPGLLR